MLRRESGERALFSRMPHKGPGVNATYFSLFEAMPADENRREQDGGRCQRQQFLANQSARQTNRAFSLDARGLLIAHRKFDDSRRCRNVLLPWVVRRCECQEFLSFFQQSVSQRELNSSRLFSDLRLFVGKSIKVIFPFRAAICQHTVSTIGVGKSAKCGAPGSALFEKSHEFRH